MHPIIRRRRAEQAGRIATANAWAEDLASRLELVAVVVFGSTARGDFNRWSDLDVLVVARDLPATARDRLELLMLEAPPGLQPIGWTPEDYSDRRRRDDPIIKEAETVGVVVSGSLPRPGT
ncbi:MAG: nucleotidyltransferase domain-containing protein [Acidimicrobiia bacterium]